MGSSLASASALPMNASMSPRRRASRSSAALPEGGAPEAAAPASTPCCSTNLGQDVVLPLLVKGDKIRLKDGTCLRYGEGFEEESEPEADPATTSGGGSQVPRAMEMRDDPDEQEQVRRLRERGSGSSTPVTPPKTKPRKGGRNKVSAFAEPSGTPPRPPTRPQGGGSRR